MTKRIKRIVGLRMLHAIARARLGFAGIQNVSPYSLVARVLQSDGIPRKEKASDKAYVLANERTLREMYDQCKKKTSSVKVIIKHETEWSPAGFIGDVKTVVRNTASSVERIWPADVDVTGDEFLKTYRWRQLRMKAIKKYGPKCQCCGASASTGAVINVDHIKPRRKHPDLALCLDNLQILCNECNHGKGNWDETDWRKAT